MLYDTSKIYGDIRAMLPVRTEIIQEGTFQGQEFKSLIDQYYYLGFDRSVGENLKYLVYSPQGKLLACLLFGSAAWSCAPRDQFIGWNALSRRNNLIYTTNNTRFLILPWVKVPHLASHILGLIVRRIAADWQKKYGHPLYLLETFVEKDRFKGTCYKAANWIQVGETTGRSRNDRYNNLQVPIKDIYLHPLQVVDVKIVPVITQHAVYSKNCPLCGKTTTATFPAGVDHYIQYGDTFRSVIVCLNQGNYIPYDRLARISRDVLGVPVSQGTLVNIVHKCGRSLKDSLAYIKDQLKQANVLHVDETGTRVKGKNHWLHSAGNDRFTYLATHPKRGNEATAAIGILPGFTGTAVHDLWKPYYNYSDCRLKGGLG